MAHIENTVPVLLFPISAVKTYLSAKPFLSNSRYIFAYLAVVVQQRFSMPQYGKLLTWKILRSSARINDLQWLIELHSSPINALKRKGPRTELCGTLEVM
jgi:hypothetical protein